MKSDRPEHHVAELRDGRVGEEPLQVVLVEVEDQADDHGHERECGHQRARPSPGNVPLSRMTRAIR